MQQNFNNGNDFNDRAVLPPRSSRFKELTVFTERAVKMQGDGYYMRVFENGSAEFVRYDETTKKWVFLCFPCVRGDACRTA